MQDTIVKYCSVHMFFDQFLCCLDINHSVQMVDVELLKPCSDLTKAVCIT